MLSKLTGIVILGGETGVTEYPSTVRVVEIVCTGCRDYVIMHCTGSRYLFIFTIFKITQNTRNSKQFSFEL